MNRDPSYSSDKYGLSPLNPHDVLPDLASVAMEMASRDPSDPVKIKVLTSALGGYAAAGAILEGTDSLWSAYAEQNAEQGIRLGDPVPATISYIRGQRTNLADVNAITEVDTVYELTELRNGWLVAKYGDEAIHIQSNVQRGTVDVNTRSGLV